MNKLVKENMVKYSEVLILEIKKKLLSKLLMLKNLSNIQN